MKSLTILHDPCLSALARRHTVDAGFDGIGCSHKVSCALILHQTLYFMTETNVTPDHQPSTHTATDTQAELLEQHDAAQAQAVSTQSDSKTSDVMFDALGLSDALVQAVTELGYKKPSPIQAQAIPAVLAGKDVMAAAQTGTGKTAGFTLPLLDILAKGKKARGNHVRALILTPTRELAAQVYESVTLYSKHLSLTSAVVFGGVKINPQMMRLRKGADILVATPGRLLDLYNQNAVKFDGLEVLILDEADRMLDMGFIHDIKRIIRCLPPQRQNLLFSATFSDEIRDLAKGLVNNPVEISVAPRNTTAKSVTQWLCPVDKSQKRALLMHLISTNRWEQVLVFTRTKHGANKLTKYLEQYGIAAAAIHGNKSQGARTRALAAFKAKEVTVLVATDIAARGIDIEQLPYVVNFELPQVAEDYVHRIGRTGRASATGQAVSLVCQEEHKQLVAIERLTQQIIERKVIADFEPTQALKATNDTRPPKAPRPKKPKKQFGGGNSKNSHSKNGNQTSNQGNSQSSNQGKSNNRNSQNRRNDNRNHSNKNNSNNSQARRDHRDNGGGNQRGNQNRNHNSNQGGNRRNQHHERSHQQDGSGSGIGKGNQSNHRSDRNSSNQSRNNQKSYNKNSPNRHGNRNQHGQGNSQENHQNRSGKRHGNEQHGWKQRKLKPRNNWSGNQSANTGHQPNKKRRYPRDENGDVNGNV